MLSPSDITGIVAAGIFVVILAAFVGGFVVFIRWSDRRVKRSSVADDGADIVPIKRGKKARKRRRKKARR